ncbi:hypothetical protein AGMMS49975_29830 [Clostridia bacterium]|nr:hypothetical protein AGMMS49975_29830 [Clostridia bacterium]
MDVLTPNRKTTVTFYRMRTDVGGKIYLEKQSVTAPAQAMRQRNSTTAQK